ncbi:Uncharacterized protein C31G5.21 [Cytospora mali]|uniref:Uncharacterized protein C31G5.21 n=1 Tax=Cytospora mali TaxID=578113 RepID=A0A194W5T5_CYTMA|nr:Uncharacterized protein C31G5.21 [Valsa mali]
MPSDEYKSAGGGALRIKGAKVKKNKAKKKEKTKSDLEKNLATTRESSKDPKTEDELAETAAQDGAGGDGAEPSTKGHKTEAERRFEEARRKKLLEKAESARPELLKTHKERVEELNTYLSKLSEHHDMPKIGPG